MVKPYSKLTKLNEMSTSEAHTVFLACSGSDTWAAAMTAARPFVMIESLFSIAEKTWFSLSEADRIAAYAAVSPKNEDKNIDDDVISQLDEANSLYRDRFGFIFILHTSGRSADEVLAICRARLRNSVETELAIAGEEQRKIIEFQLTRFLET